jgi:hypothetical protein
MDALRLEPAARDDDGWVEIVQVTQPMDEQPNGTFAANEDGEASEPEPIGWVREVEGTEEQATVWYDARVIDPTLGAVERRFPSFEGAITALAVRTYYPPDARTSVGW